MCELNWFTYKINSKPILVSPNLDPNMSWILAENKLLTKPKQALGYSWNNKNKTHKLIPYVAVRREEEEEEKTIKVWYKTYL